MGCALLLLDWSTRLSISSAHRTLLQANYSYSQPFGCRESIPDPRAAEPFPPSTQPNLHRNDRGAVSERDRSGSSTNHHHNAIAPLPSATLGCPPPCMPAHETQCAIAHRNTSRVPSGSAVDSPRRFPVGTDGNTRSPPPPSCPPRASCTRKSPSPCARDPPCSGPPRRAGCFRRSP